LAIQENREATIQAIRVLLEIAEQPALTAGPWPRHHRPKRSLPVHAGRWSCTRDIAEPQVEARHATPCLQARADRPFVGGLRRGGVQPTRLPVLREEPPMPEKCVTCGLLFRTSNELDWHIREEHTQRAAPPPRADREPEPGADREPEPGADREPEPGATAMEPPDRPRWLIAARRLFGRRPPESPSGRGRGKA
jgi:hypothetical protein